MVKVKASGQPTQRPRPKKALSLPLSRPATLQDVIELARQHGPIALEALVSVLQSGTDAAKVSAAKEILDRGFGKVGQPVEVTGHDGKALTMEIGISPAVAAALEAISKAGA